MAPSSAGNVPRVYSHVRRAPGCLRAAFIHRGQLLVTVAATSVVFCFILSPCCFFFVHQIQSNSQSKKGKSPSNQRELSVVMPNGQSIQVKCEVKSRGGDVFDMIVAHSNLMEHFYFGLAYTDGKYVLKNREKWICSLECFQAVSVPSSDNEFFFVDNDTKISKVAPDSWKKVPTTTFVLYFRVKFFVNDISLLL